MTIDDVPAVLSVKQLSEFINKSESWLYEQWSKKGNDLPPKFKIGRNSRILGQDAVDYLQKQVDFSMSAKK